MILISINSNDLHELLLVWILGIFGPFSLLEESDYSASINLIKQETCQPVRITRNA